MTSPDFAIDPKFHWKQNLFGSHKSCPAGIQACNSDSRMQIPEFVRGFLDERPSRTCLDPIKFDDDQTFSEHAKAKLIQCENDAALFVSYIHCSNSYNLVFAATKKRGKILNPWIFNKKLTNDQWILLHNYLEKRNRNYLEEFLGFCKSISLHDNTVEINFVATKRRLINCANFIMRDSYELMLSSMLTTTTQVFQSSWKSASDWR